MKKLIVFFLVLLLACSAGFAAKKKHKVVKKAPSPPSITERLKKIETFTADFTQVTSIKNFSKDTYKGKVYMEAGKAALWDYSSPYKQYYLFNENGMEFYDSSTNQLVKQNKESSQEANVILSILFNLKNIEKNFIVSLNGKDKIQLKPKVEIGLKYLIISLNKQNQITNIYSEDKDGNVTDITFSNIKINTALKKDIFNVKAPEDAQVFQY